MKLSELTERGRADVMERLRTEEQSWGRSAIWWMKGETEAQRQMQKWCAEFTQFKTDVIANDRDIDEAFQEWSGQPTRLTDYNKINVPQLGFIKTYTRAVRDAEEMKANP